MRPASPSDSSELERLWYGALFGGFLGALIGFLEFLLVLRMQQSAPIHLAQAWEVTLPYTIVGLLGGICTAVGVRFVLSVPSSLSQFLAGFLASFLALVTFFYLVAWTTYDLKLSSKVLKIGAYLISAVATTGMGFLLNRALSGFLGRLEDRSTFSQKVFKIGLPASLVLLTAALLILPSTPGEKSWSTPSLPAGSSPSTAKEQWPNIVFILVDTLRAGHLSIYGYSRQTAPYLTALAQQGMTFTHLYTQASWTKPSVATILSSLYPSVHQVNSLRAFFADSITTLPEVLRAAGYTTFGVSANPIIGPTFGYDQGFEEFHVAEAYIFRFTTLRKLTGSILRKKTRADRLFRLKKRQVMLSRAEPITDVALQWAAHNHNQPFFLYVHYIDPHEPYNPPPPYNQMFDYRQAPPRYFGERTAARSLPQDVNPQKIELDIDQYDGEILYTDFDINRLLTELQKMGVMDNAITILTADHGEEFFEHGKAGHGESAYQEILHVPFLIRWPGHIPANATYNGVAGLIDVMPTLLNLVGIEPPSGMQGTSLAGLLTKPSNAEPERPVFSETVGIATHQLIESVLRGQQKLIHYASGPKQGQKEFYDLDKDPQEQADLVAQVQPQVIALQQELAALNKLTGQAAQHIEARQVELDKSTEKVLRSLGYIK